MDEQDDRVVRRLRALADQHPSVAHMIQPWWTRLEMGEIHRYEAVVGCLEFFADQHARTLQRVEDLLLTTSTPTVVAIPPDRIKAMERHLASERSVVSLPPLAASTGRRKARAVAVEEVQLPGGDDAARAAQAHAAVMDLGSDLFWAAEPDVLDLPLLVWTDGSGTSKDSPAGIGVVFEDRGKKAGFGEYIGCGTNNVAELTAVQRALQVVRGQHRFRPITIHADSQYAIGALTKEWELKANMELVAAIRAEMKHFARLTFVHVPGHAGVDGNEKADKLAGAAVKAKGVVRL